MEVAESINELIQEKNIFNQLSTKDLEQKTENK
jgi:hypothetical protein